MDHYAVVPSTRIARPAGCDPSFSVPQGGYSNQLLPTRTARRLQSRLQHEIYRLFQAAAQGETLSVGGSAKGEGGAGPWDLPVRAKFPLNFTLVLVDAKLYKPSRRLIAMRRRGRPDPDRHFSSRFR